MTLTRSTAMKMISVLALAFVLASAGCNKSHAGGSSGSNWLTCETLADCDGAADAVSCSADGYCLDHAGKRIAAGTPPEAQITGRANGRTDAGPTDAAGTDAEPTDAAGTDAEPTDAGPSLGDGSLDATCDWDLDLLLGQIGVALPERQNCGTYNAAVTSDVMGAMACFDAAIAQGKAVELTINRCIDCNSFAIYAASASGRRFELFGSGSYQLGNRDFFVNECDAIVFDPETSNVTCAASAQRYRCLYTTDAGRPAELDALESAPKVPVTPFKLADVAAPSDDAVTLHLYVINSNVPPSAQLDVSVDFVHVVTGAFGATDGQNADPLYAFDVKVPAGKVTLRAWSADGVSAEQPIEAPADRWVTLTYFDVLEKGHMFSIDVSDVAIGFQ